MRAYGVSYPSQPVAGMEFLERQISSGLFLFDTTMARAEELGCMDLFLRVSLRTNKPAVTYEGVHIVFNGDYGNNYSRYLMYHQFDSAWNDEATAAGAPLNVLYANAANAPSGCFASYDITIYDFLSTAKTKFAQVRGGQTIVRNTTSMYIYDSTFEWHPAAHTKISSIYISPESSGGNVHVFVEGSSAALYGLR